MREQKQSHQNMTIHSEEEKVKSKIKRKKSVNVQLGKTINVNSNQVYKIKFNNGKPNKKV